MILSKVFCQQRTRSYGDESKSLALPLLRSSVKTSLRPRVRSSNKNVRTSSTRYPSLPANDAIRASSSNMHQWKPNHDHAKRWSATPYNTRPNTSNTNAL